MCHSCSIEERHTLFASKTKVGAPFRQTKQHNLAEFTVSHKPTISSTMLTYSREQQRCLSLLYDFFDFGMTQWPASSIKWQLHYPPVASFGHHNGCTVKQDSETHEVHVARGRVGKASMLLCGLPPLQGFMDPEIPLTIVNQQL